MFLFIFSSELYPRRPGTDNQQNGKNNGDDDDGDLPVCGCAHARRFF